LQQQLHSNTNSSQQQQLLQQELQTNCDIYPYVISNRPSTGQSTSAALQGLNNSSAQSLHGSNSTVHKLNNSGSALPGRVLFTKNNSVCLNIPTGGLEDVNIPSEVQGDILGLHRRLDPDILEVQSLLKDP
jgi:hypothetical protein